MARKIYVFTFYRFLKLNNLKKLKKKIDDFVDNEKIFGTILIAREGINGTLAGKKEDLNLFNKKIKKLLNIRKLTVKISNNSFIPFYRLKVRIKQEIVALGEKSIRPNKKTGKYISPENWDRIINNKEYLIIDTRNIYEINIGTFKNAMNPKTNSFREFPSYIEVSNIKKNKPIAMFCTGGIRCEKASAYLIQKGYKNISQLDGGIQNYLEYKKDKKNNSWIGECFVFDNRVSINKKLEKGTYEQCHGCRHPIKKSDMKLKSFRKGVSCKYCINDKSEQKKISSITRQKQIDKAEKSNFKHSFKKIYFEDI